MKNARECERARVYKERESAKKRHARRTPKERERERERESKERKEERRREGKKSLSLILLNNPRTRVSNLSGYGKKKENDVCDDIANNFVEEHRWWSLKIEQRFVFFFFSFLARCASMPPRRDDSDERRQRFVFLFFECL